MMNEWMNEWMIDAEGTKSQTKKKKISDPKGKEIWDNRRKNLPSMCHQFFVPPFEYMLLLFDENYAQIRKRD